MCRACQNPDHVDATTRHPRLRAALKLFLYGFPLVFAFHAAVLRAAAVWAGRESVLLLLDDALAPFAAVLCYAGATRLFDWLDIRSEEDQVALAREYLVDGYGLPARALWGKIVDVTDSDYGPTFARVWYTGGPFEFDDVHRDTLHQVLLACDQRWDATAYEFVVPAMANYPRVPAMAAG